MKRSSHIRVVAALVLLTAACASKGATPPTKAVAPAGEAVPACPSTIVPGGDPLEAAGFEGKSIARVCLVGGSEESRKAAERVSLLHAGDTLAATRVRAGLDGLMKLGLLE